MNWQHVYPLNEEHELTGFSCKCEPKIDWDNEIVIHNSFNHREIIEEVKEILSGTPLP
jgi:hypothetical protein